MDNFSNKGRTRFAAHRGFALCSATTTAMSALAGAAGSEAKQQQQQQLNDILGPNTPIHQLGFTFAHVVGSAIATGIIISALEYKKCFRSKAKHPSGD
jgi:2-methylcitrate dehydratase PrpD